MYSWRLHFDANGLCTSILASRTRIAYRAQVTRWVRPWNAECVNYLYSPHLFKNSQRIEPARRAIELVGRSIAVENNVTNGMVMHSYAEIARSTYSVQASS